MILLSGRFTTKSAIGPGWSCRLLEGVMGVPRWLAGWLVENPSTNWRMTAGYPPYFRTPPYLGKCLKSSWPFRSHQKIAGSCGCRSYPAKMTSICMNMYWSMAILILWWALNPQIPSNAPNGCSVPKKYGFMIFNEGRCCCPSSWKPSCPLVLHVEIASFPQTPTWTHASDHVLW